MKILLVKTSSMGDVIHNLPVVSDIHAHLPDAAIDWVVEESFSEVPRLHPGVRRIIPVALRRWRGQLLRTAVWREIRRFVQVLQSEAYDLVLDTQGLVKSALIARWARGERAGYGRDSAREPFAALFYQRRFSVDRQLHAVERNRRLAGLALGYNPAAQVDYGIAPPERHLPWLPPGRYAVLLHATSRADKLWPEARWVGLGQHLLARGIVPVLPWGSPAEQERSRRLAAALPGALVPPALSLTDATAMLGGALLAVGVDTGLTHLATALKVPVVALYCASSPGLTGVYGSARAVNLGSAAAPPSLDQVWGAAAPFAAA